MYLQAARDALNAISASNPDKTTPTEVQACAQTAQAMALIAAAEHLGTIAAALTKAKETTSADNQATPNHTERTTAPAPAGTDPAVETGNETDSDPAEVTAYRDRDGDVWTRTEDSMWGSPTLNDHVLYTFASLEARWGPLTPIAWVSIEFAPYLLDADGDTWRRIDNGLYRHGAVARTMVEVERGYGPVTRLYTVGQ